MGTMMHPILPLTALNFYGYYSARITHKGGGMLKDIYEFFTRVEKELNCRVTISSGGGDGVSVRMYWLCHDYAYVQVFTPMELSMGDNDALMQQCVDKCARIAAVLNNKNRVNYRIVEPPRQHCGKIASE